MISEEMLCIASARASEIYVTYLEDGYDSKHQYIFSMEFEKKIERLKRRADHPFFYKAMQRIASFILAVLIASGAWLAVDAEARATFVGWIKETYEMLFVYRYSGGIGIPIEEKNYRLGWIPEGYSEYLTIDENGGLTVLYKHESGKLMKFGYIHDPNSNVWYVDTLDTVRSDSLVNGIPADLFISKSSDVASIVMWTVDSENSAFYISGFFDEKELISIAESVKEEK